MKTEGQKINIFHIDVLDGIRVLAVFVVAWFHFWQQAWVTPAVFGIDTEWIARTGYVMVDLLILISGFCLFLPHARAMVTGEKVISAKEFYKRRLARIYPSYLFSIVLVLLVFAIPQKMYQSADILIKDVLAHLTLTHTFFRESYLYTNLNGALWTVGIEVQFYLICPLLSKWFKRHPIFIYSIMTGISILFNNYIIHNTSGVHYQMLMNQLPTFLGVYANGMMGAYLFVAICEKKTRKRHESVLYTVISIFCLYIYYIMMQNLYHSQAIQVWQVAYRYQMSILFIIFIISTALACDTYRFLFSNKIMRFLSGISFNFYIWHQFLAVQLKKLRIPYWTGDTPPNQTGDRAWMWKYFILIWAVAFAAAILTTYGIEKPLAKLILKKKKAPSSQRD